MSKHGEKKEAGKRTGWGGEIKGKKEEDAAKCAKLTDIFCGGAAVSQAADDTGPSTASAG